MSQPAPQPIWLTPACILLSIYTLKLTGHLESLCNAVLVFLLTSVAANTLFPVTAQEDSPPRDPFSQELQERLARIERVRVWRESAAVQYGSSSEEKETEEVKEKPTPKKKPGIRKVLKEKFIPQKKQVQLGARRLSEEEVVPMHSALE
jgi:hypothetical protein